MKQHDLPRSTARLGVEGSGGNSRSARGPSVKRVSYSSHQTILARGWRPTEERAVYHGARAADGAVRGVQIGAMNIIKEGGWLLAIPLINGSF